MVCCRLGAGLPWRGASSYIFGSYCWLRLVEKEPQVVSTDAGVRRLAPWLTIAVMVLVAIVFLRWQGRVWWCQQGDFWPVSIKVESPHSSQHLFDPYSLSHLLHGLLFFGLLWLFRRWIDFRWRLVAATAIEVFWEM